MEGTAQEFHSLTSTFGFYALYRVGSRSGSMSDIWHCSNTCPKQLHITTLTKAMRCLFCAPCSQGLFMLSERQGLQERAALEDGVARRVPVRELTHLLLTVTCRLHETVRCCCSLGHSIGYAAKCSLFSSAWQTHQEKLESERAPRFLGFCSPIKRKEEKKDVPKAVWNKTEESCPCP